MSQYDSCAQCKDNKGWKSLKKQVSWGAVGPKHDLQIQRQMHAWKQLTRWFHHCSPCSLHWKELMASGLQSKSNPTLSGKISLCSAVWLCSFFNPSVKSFFFWYASWDVLWPYDRTKWPSICPKLLCTFNATIASQSSPFIVNTSICIHLYSLDSHITKNVELHCLIILIY